MDNLTPEELEAHRRALEILQDNPGLQSVHTDKSPDMGGMGDKSDIREHHLPPEPPKAGKEDPYANEPFAPPMIKRLFPQGTPILDPSGGGGMVIGAVKPVAKAAAAGLNMRRIKELLASGEEAAPRMFGDAEKTAVKRQIADETADMAEMGITNANDVQRTTEQMNREIANQERAEAQRAAKLQRIKEMTRKK